MRGNTMLRITTLSCLCVLAILMPLLPAGAETADPAADVSEIKVFFKLDPRLTRGMYMGDRWVSPPTFTSVLPLSKEVAVEARADALDAAGRKMGIIPEWTAANPDMIKVSPTQGRKVKIIVLKEGRSDLSVTFQGKTKKLSVTGLRKETAMQVDITQ